MNRQASNNTGPNDPREFDELGEAKRRCLLLWIELAIQPAVTIGRRDSYALKHAFEHEGGFYVTNGVFKDAMRQAGYEPVDAAMMNWQFRVKPLRRRTGKYYGYALPVYAGYGLDQITLEQQAAYAEAYRQAGSPGYHPDRYPWLVEPTGGDGEP